MPESLIFLTENSPGVSNDRFGFKRKESSLRFFSGKNSLSVLKTVSVLRRCVRMGKMQGDESENEGAYCCCFAARAGFASA